MSNSRRALDERDGSNFCPANAIRVIYEHLVTDADSIIDYRDTDVLAQFKGVNRPANFTSKELKLLLTAYYQVRSYADATTQSK